MYFGKFALCAVVLGGALAAQPASATTFLSGSVRSLAAYTFTGPAASDPDSASTTAPGTIIADSAVSYFASDTQAISVFSSVGATWESADSGSVDMEWGWNINTIGRNVPLTVNTWTRTPSPDWSYSFIASRNGVFTLDYRITPTGFVFGLGSIVGIGGLATIPAAANTSVIQGSQSIALVAGQSYAFGLQNTGNISNSGTTYANARSVAAFDWAITYDAIPEPASWATMICGFGIAGASLRRRRGAASSRP